ncbi:M28 family peptidase [Fontivita pretiosa]|uniref:M28 family peptidase n=1 Tax=Fontivita pretiosa TaxID=2989684 RepID=UPI003D17DAB2
MPGQSFRGPLPPLTPQQRELRQQLFDHVNMLAGVIGQRNVYTSGSLESTIAYLSRIWRDQGYEVREQPYPIHNTMVKNLEVEIRGETRPDEIVIVGAHYDTPLGVPGANDNASGVAAMLEISRLLRQPTPARTLRFVAFVNEEPPAQSRPS